MSQKISNGIDFVTTWVSNICKLALFRSVNGMRGNIYLIHSYRDTVTPANAIMYIWDWVLRLPHMHAGEGITGI